MKHGLTLVDLFKQHTAGHALWPPLHNMKPFFQVNGWNTNLYFDGIYQDRTPFPLLIITTPDQSAVYLSEEKPSKLAVEFFTQYLRHPAVLAERQKLFAQSEQTMDNLYKTYSCQAVTKLDEGALLTALKQVHTLLWSTNTALFFSISFDRTIASTGVDKNTLEAFWDRAVEPTEESFDLSAKRVFLTAVANGLTGSPLVEACQYMFTSYTAVYSTNYITEKLTEKFPKKLFKPENAKKELQKMDAALVDKRAAFVDFKKNHKQDEQNIIKFIQAVITLRDQRKGFLAKGLTVLWRIAERLSELVQLPVEHLPHVTINELLGGAVQLQKLNKQLIKRVKGSVMLVGADGSIHISHHGVMEAQMAMQSHYEKLSEVDRTVLEINGQIGSRGVAEGTVRVVFDPEKADHFTEGDILVTGMTRPEFVPLMGRAAAIITDEGGVTCHAAIISREMRIPCIIGTRIGSLVLRDGERVRVDAHNGVVYRLESL